MSDRYEVREPNFRADTRCPFEVWDTERDELLARFSHRSGAEKLAANYTEDRPSDEEPTDDPT